MLTKVRLKICQKLGERLRNLMKKKPGAIETLWPYFKSSECHVPYATRIV